MILIHIIKKLLEWRGENCIEKNKTTERFRRLEGSVVGLWREKKKRKMKI